MDEDNNSSHKSENKDNNLNLNKDCMNDIFINVDNSSLSTLSDDFEEPPHKKRKIKHNKINLSDVSSVDSDEMLAILD